MNTIIHIKNKWLNIKHLFGAVFHPHQIVYQFMKETVFRVFCDQLFEAYPIGIIFVFGKKVINLFDLGFSMIKMNSQLTKML